MLQNCVTLEKAQFKVRVKIEGEKHIYTSKVVPVKAWQMDGLTDKWTHNPDT